MSSKRLFWLSTLHLFSTSLLLLSGVFCLFLFFSPGVRFDLAGSLNDNRLWIVFAGGSMVALSSGLLGAFWWMTREKVIQVKLTDGSMSLGKELIEKAVVEFWQGRFESTPTVAIDGSNRIEIFDQGLKEEQLKLLDTLLQAHLRQKLGASPEVVLCLKP